MSVAVSISIGLESGSYGNFVDFTTLRKPIFLASFFNTEVLRAKLLEAWLT